MEQQLYNRQTDDTQTWPNVLPQLQVWVVTITAAENNTHEYYFNLQLNKKLCHISREQSYNKGNDNALLTLTKTDTIIIAYLHKILLYGLLWQTTNFRTHLLISHKTRQDNGEKRMQVQVPLYPYPCYTLN